MSDADKKIMEEIAVFWTNAQPSVSAFIISIMPRFQDADDILQQVAVSVVKNYDKYDKKESFTGWAIGIAKNELLMYWRNHSKSRLIFDIKTIDAISEAHEKEAVAFNPMRKALDICIQKITGRTRQILEMRYFNELSVSRIAQKVGMTPGAIYTLLHRVRIALQECINRQISTGDYDGI
jgi:RNA polymerase sigma-70 factor (ECF subfamily)